MDVLRKQLFKVMASTFTDRQIRLPTPMIIAQCEILSGPIHAVGFDDRIPSTIGMSEVDNEVSNPFAEHYSNISAMRYKCTKDRNLQMPRDIEIHEHNSSRLVLA